MKFEDIAAAVNQIAVPFFITDLDPKILFVNDSYCEMTGYRREDLIGKNPGIVKSGETPIEVYEDLWATINTGNSWSGHLSYRKKSGKIFIHSLVISPVRNEEGTIYRYVASWQDVTEREMKSQYFEKMVKTLEDSGESLEHFISRAAHDLKAPIRHIKTFSQKMMKIGDDDPDGDEHQILIERIHAASQRMQKLIDATLSLSRIKQDRLEIGEVDLNEVTQEVLEDLEIPIKETDATVVIRHLPTVYADSTLMYELFLNLINNAIKYRRYDVKPCIDIESHIDNEAYIISVVDNGIGIENDHLNLIFDSFQRLHSQSKYEGVGM